MTIELGVSAAAVVAVVGGAVAAAVARPVARPVAVAAEVAVAKPGHKSKRETLTTIWAATLTTEIECNCRPLALCCHYCQVCS